MRVSRSSERRTHRRDRLVRAAADVPSEIDEIVVPSEIVGREQVDLRPRDLVVVANRLPVQREETGWHTSPGGLVTAVGPALGDQGAAWVGWTGQPDDLTAPFEHDDLLLWPVTLDRDEVRDAYEGFSNTTLWPLYHDAIRRPEFRAEWWDAYVVVNERFARSAVRCAAVNGTVWVHDYQLQLVPSMVRAMRPDVRIGFFLHIPQPPTELFSRLPWRREILEGLLGADVIGFQTEQGATNFIAAANQILGVDVDAHSFPIAIDTDSFSRLAATPAVEAKAAELRASLGDPRVVLLGVDRLDYTKGIEARLLAFREALRTGRLTVPDVTMVQLAVPSRADVAGYADERARVERLIGEINGDFGLVGSPAVHYLHRSFELDDLVALYRAADVMLVTPYCDGMNLVAKEYVASRVDDGGVLLLSEFTGAARELREAVLVNPYDNEAMVDALVAAVNLEPDDRRARMRALRHRVEQWTVCDWSRAFLQALASVP